MSATTERAVRVLTVDDQAVARVAARDVIDATPGFEALAAAASGPEALKLCATLEPDLILMDVRMPGMDGIETARRLRASDPDAVVVLISLEQIPDLPSSISTVGAAAYVRKQDLTKRGLADLWAAHGPR
jgi:two-component system, NarL family, invasion response regulator UvrY